MNGHERIGRKMRAASLIAGDENEIDFVVRCPLGELMFGFIGMKMGQSHWFGIAPVRYLVICFASWSFTRK